MRFGTFSGRVAAMLVLLFGAGNVSAEPSLSAGTTAGVPGGTNLVPVSVTVDTNVVTFQFDVLYATNWIAPGTPVGGSALSDQYLVGAVVTQGQFRVLAASFTDSPITNGVAVYVPFTITNNAPDHDETLVLSNVVFVSALAEPVPVTVVSNATLSVTVPPRFTAISPANGGVIHLDLAGSTGRVYVIEATTDLVQPQWSALATNTATNGVAPFDDPSAAAFSNRFYRGRFLQ